MHPISILLLIVALVGSISLARAEQCAYSEYRLPEHIRPSHYDVSFDIDVSNPTYGGSVTIHLNVTDEPDKAPKNVIVLHAAPTLNVGEVHYHPLGQDDDQDKGKHDVADVVQHICRDDENELLVVTLKENLSIGSRGQLVATFKADYNADCKGLFRVPYEEPDGSVSGYVSNLFEPADARKAFPCFDEPSFKATFDLTLNSGPAQMFAVANTPVKSTEINEATKIRTTKFNTTPPMSTYLLAFVIGSFEFEEKVIGNGGIPVRVYTRPSRKNDGKFALETAVKAITLLEEYFNIPFPLEKLDLVALPKFAAGKAAMENWGVLTFDESYLLQDYGYLTPKREYYVATCVTHEVAHQWFGNMVTMKWWDDLWLNEGFATWMAGFMVSQLYPEIKADHYRLTSLHEMALSVDTPLSTHPIISFDHVGKDIDKIFDRIVYLKSASIISYLHDGLVGPEKFKEGVRNYLSKNLYGNVESSDFWDELTAVSGKPVDTFLQSWLTQSGHPLVRVKLDSQGKKLLLEQGRDWPCIKKSAESKDQHSCERPDENDQKWMIPITVLVSDGSGRQEKLEGMFDQKTMEVELPEWFDSTDKNHWLVLNEDSKGFYRVLYEDKLLQRLAEPCSSKQLGTFARADLVDGLRSHYENGLIDIGVLKDSFSWFVGEREGVVLKNLVETFRVLLSDFEGILAKPRMHLLGEKLFVPIFQENGMDFGGKRVSFIEESGFDDVLRTLVMLNYQPAVEKALRRFDLVVKRPILLESSDVVAVRRYGTKEQKESLSEAAKILNS